MFDDEIIEKISNTGIYWSFFIRYYQNMEIVYIVIQENTTLFHAMVIEDNHYILTWMY